VGRPRWLQLVKGLEQSGAHDALHELRASSEFVSADSDQRFALALQAVSPGRRASKRRPASSDRVAWVEKKGGNIRLVSDNAGFASFLQRRFPALLEEFKSSPEAKSKKTPKGATH
jgi:ParB family chromosome partitioning protein